MVKRIVVVVLVVAVAALAGCSNRVGDLAQQMEDLRSRLTTAETNLAQMKDALSKAVADQVTATTALQGAINRLQADQAAVKDAQTTSPTVSRPLVAVLPPPSRTAITDVLRRNVQAANDEDVSAYMATIHPSSPMYTTTETLLRQLNDVYDLNYQLESVAVLESSEDEASVSFVLVTRRVSGTAFQDNRVTGTWILRTYRGEWRIYDQVVIKVEYLN